MADRFSGNVPTSRVRIVSRDDIAAGSVFVRFVEYVSRYTMLEKKISAVPEVNAPFYFKGELYRVREVNVIGGSDSVGFEVAVQKPVVPASSRKRK